MTDKDVYALKFSSPTSFLCKPTSKISVLMLTLLIILLVTFGFHFVTHAFILYLNGFPAYHPLQFPHS